MATTVKFGSKPKGFQMIPEGEHVVHISDVKAIPRANPTVVTMKMLNADGLGWDKYPQKYDLNSDGGYAAFYYLVQNGLGVNLDECNEFDVEQLEGAYVTVEVIHKAGKGDNEGKTYANIKATVGPGEPFGDTPVAVAAAGGDDSEGWED
jgi:hypothetical protein